MKVKITVIAAAACGLLMSAAQADQIPNPENIPVSVKVHNECIIDGATESNFNTHGLLIDASNTESTISLRCTGLTPYRVNLDNGGNFTGTRHMKNATGELLAYGLYMNAARTLPWIDPLFNVGIGTGNITTPQTFTVYAKMPSQVAFVGSYTDNVKVTVTF